MVGDEARQVLKEALEMQDTPEKDVDPQPDFVLPEAPKAATKRLDFTYNQEVPDIPVRVGYRSVDPRICQLLVDSMR